MMGIPETSDPSESHVCRIDSSSIHRGERSAHTHTHTHTHTTYAMMALDLERSAVLREHHQDLTRLSLLRALVVPGEARTSSQPIQELVHTETPRNECLVVALYSHGTTTHRMRYGASEELVWL